MKIMPITDKNTGLIVGINDGNNNQIISVTFFGAPQFIDSIRRQLSIFEMQSYEASLRDKGRVRSVVRQQNPDGSLTITKGQGSCEETCKEALLFIAEHKFEISLNLDSETRRQLKQVCSREVITHGKDSSFFGKISPTLFHRKPTVGQTPNQTPDDPLPDHQQTTPICLIQ